MQQEEFFQLTAGVIQLELLSLSDLRSSNGSLEAQIILCAICVCVCVCVCVCGLR